ncbi:MAG: hypothetical protein GY820_00035 [Gammaproteobacteria bacterium]|nr:hypothetical protein [Gammaproteobacteria bacterium]
MGDLLGPPQNQGGRKASRMGDLLGPPQNPGGSKSVPNGGFIRPAPKSVPNGGFIRPAPKSPWERGKGGPPKASRMGDLLGPPRGAPKSGQNPGFWGVPQGRGPRGQNWRRGGQDRMNRLSGKYSLSLSGGGGVGVVCGRVVGWRRGRARRRR